jgi:non-lysosomal glucosylceramidase
MESMYGCPINETMVCRFYGAIATLLFWPELEKNTLRQFAAHQREDGAIPFIFGGKCGFDEPNYELQKSLDSSEFVALAHRYFYYTGDGEFAAALYPAVQQAIAYAAALDLDGDGLVDEVSGQYFDCWQFYGHSSYVSSVWLLALRAAEALAQRLGRGEDAARYRAMRERGQRRFEELLWTGTHYRIFRDPATGRTNDGCLVSQTIGEWFAATCGLRGILPEDRVAASLERVLARNAPLSKLGIVNSSVPEGGMDMTGFNGFSCTITIGDTYAFADHLIRRGQVEPGLEVAERMVHSVTQAARAPWGQTWNCSARDGRMLLMTDYYSNLVVWSLYQSLTGRRQIAEE